MSKSLKLIDWIIKTLYSAFPQLIIIFTLIQIAISVIPLIESYYFSHLIDNLISYYQNGNNLWIRTLTVMVSILVVKMIIRTLKTFITRILGFKLESYLRQLFVSKISGLDYQHLEDKDTANLIAKVKEEYQWRYREAFNLIFDTIIQITGLISVVAILAPRYWYLVLLILIGEIPGFIVDNNFNKQSWKFFNDNTLKNRQSWDLATYLSNKSYLSELSVNHSVDYLKNKFDEILDFFTTGRLKLRWEKLPRDIITSLISITITALGLLIIIKDIRLGLISVGMFTFYYSTLRQSGEFFISTINNYVNVTEHLQYLENFKKVIELKNIIVSGSLKTDFSGPPTIIFKNVSFKYPQSNRYVFKNLSLTIKPGEEIALVGVNGVGKSTFIKLICRFYDPTDGEITINGINLKNLDLDLWHNQLSILFQEFTRYPSLTLKENVLLSSSSKSRKNKIISALKKSDAYNFVQKYKNGLETNMSQRYGGEEPSWGQWQKIAISRIFYKDSPVMILDEPTASIDAVSENSIFNNLYRKSTNKTVIIISHRFSTVRNAQRILVVDKGVIIEEGTHEELMRLQGVYYKSFRLQAKGYQEDLLSSRTSIPA